MTLIALDLGCGNRPFFNSSKDLTNFKKITLDIRKEVNPDIVCDLKNLPFERESIDYIFSDNVLEHFGRNETHKILDGWVRVLKVGGELEIIVPNILWAAHKLMETRHWHDEENIILEEDTVISVLYGDQTYETNYHKMGFMKNNLQRELEILNLEIKRIDEDGYELKMIATKS